MKTRAIGGGLAVVWLGVLGFMAPVGLAQTDPPKDGVSVGVGQDGPTAGEAQALQQAGRWEEAAAAWGAVVEREPENGRAVFNLGYCLHADGRLDEALRMHRRASGFDEFRGIALYNAGCAHALLGETDEAIKALTASQAVGFSLDNAMQDVDLDSLHGDPRFVALLAPSRSDAGFMGRLRQLAGQAQMMYSLYAPELKRNLDDVRSQAEAGAQLVVMRIMQDERLGPIAMRVMQFFQGRGDEVAPSVLIGDAQRLQQAQEWEAAAGVFAEVLVGEPDNADAAFGYAYSLLMAGEYDAAIEAHKRAAAFPQRRGIALYNLGCVYALTGDADKAFEALKGAHAAGFEVKDYVETDSDLESLREDPRFELLVIEVNGGL